MSLLRAWLTLVWLSFRRLLWSASTLMIFFPLAAGALFLLRRRYGAMEDVEAAFAMYSNFLILVFASILIPICALAYGTASVGGDREDRTLLFLLVRPIPRWLILLAKFTATLPLTIGLTAASFFIYCRLAGEPGELAYQLYLPTVLFITLAYVSLFHLFAVVAAARHDCGFDLRDLHGGAARQPAWHHQTRGGQLLRPVAHVLVRSKRRAYPARILRAALGPCRRLGARRHRSRRNFAGDADL